MTRDVGAAMRLCSRWGVLFFDWFDYIRISDLYNNTIDAATLPSFENFDGEAAVKQNGEQDLSQSRSPLTKKVAELGYFLFAFLIMRKTVS